MPSQNTARISRPPGPVTKPDVVRHALQPARLRAPAHPWRVWHVPADPPAVLLAFQHRDHGRGAGRTGGVAVEEQAEHPSVVIRRGPVLVLPGSAGRPRISRASVEPVMPKERIVSFTAAMPTRRINRFVAGVVADAHREIDEVLDGRGQPRVEMQEHAAARRAVRVGQHVRIVQPERARLRPAVHLDHQRDLHHARGLEAAIAALGPASAPGPSRATPTVPYASARRTASSTSCQSGSMLSSPPRARVSRRPKRYCVGRDAPSRREARA